MSYIYPGFCDGHYHVSLFQRMGTAIDLEGLKTKEAAFDKIAAGIKTCQDDIVLVINWNTAAYALSPADLEKFDRELVGFDPSFHSAIANRAGVNFLNLPEDTQDVGEDGTMGERAIYPILDRVGYQTLEENKAAILAQQEELLKLGIVALREMYISNRAEVEAYAALRSSGALKLWVALYFRPHLIIELASEGSDLLKHCAGAKILEDGAIGAMSAAVSDEYIKEPYGKGRLEFTADELESLVAKLRAYGINNFVIHAIGDRAIGEVLETYRRFWSAGVSTEGWSIEHFEMPTEEQVRLALQMGITASVQPSFIIQDREYVDRLGSERVNRLNPLAMFIRLGYKAGDNLIFGTDGMPYPPDPLRNLRCATGREVPVTSEQKLSDLDAIKAITFMAAEGDKVILNGDPFDPKTQVLQTWIGDELVYQR